MHISRCFIVLLVVSAAAMFLVSGCRTNSNEGAIEYRRATPLGGFEEAETLNKLDSGAGNTSSAKRVTSLADQDIAKPSARTFEKLDKISFRLRDGYLWDCHENRFGRNYFSDRHINCEIGILVRVFEIGGDQDFNFGPGAEENARLVYFSNDVQVRQFFNFHNLTVYGPTGYQGRPIGVEVYMIEIDAENEQTIALLDSLANAGKLAYPAASPVLGVLHSLGGSLLSSGTDDMNFRYTLALDPAGGHHGTMYAIAEAGDYVFMRTQDRRKKIEWDKLKFDHNTGRVVDQNGEDYRDHTYITLQVLKNAGSDDVNVAQDTYAEFRQALARHSKGKADTLREDLTATLNSLAQVVAFESAQESFGKITACKRAECNLTCRRAAFDLHQQVVASLQRHSACDNPSPASKPNAQPKSEGSQPNDLSTEQLEYLLKRMRERDGAVDEASLKKFTPCEFSKVKFEDFVADMCN